MRFLFIVFMIHGLGQCSSAMAGNWVAKSKFKDPTAKAWSKETRCVAMEGGECVRSDNKDRRRWRVGFLTPDVLRTVDCNHAADCESKTLGARPEFSCRNAGTPTWDDKANWPALDFSPRENTGWFLWCQIEGLVVDASGSAAVDAEESAKAADKTSRETKRSNRRDAIVACARLEAPTNVQLRQCLRAMAREMVRLRLDTSEL